MTFVFLKPWNGNPEGVWWEWDEQNMKLRNFMGGGFDIDENSDYWINAQIKEVDSWHELYVVEHWNPLEVDVKSSDVWISPKGEYFEGDTHAVAAHYICKLVYGLDIDIFAFDSAEDYLISHGWVKATCSLMWTIYQERDTTWRMTQNSFDALFDYCKFHGQQMPKKIEIIDKFVAEIGGIYGEHNESW